MKYVDGRPGGFDPHARIPDMDLDGIDAAFLYPSVGPVRRRHQGPEARRRGVPRLQPLAGGLLPALSRPALRRRHAADAVDRPRHRGDALRAQGARHARRASCAPTRTTAACSTTRTTTPFWNEVEELDVAIGLHEGASGGMPQVGVDRFTTRGARHIISHTMEMMLAAMSVIWEGVCDRHPARPHRVHGVGRRLDRAVARPHGPPLRRPGLQRLGPQHAAERAVPAQLLDLVRAGGGQPQRARRLHRPAQDPLGHGLSASRRLLPRRAEA